jgi:hypothetical protein
MSGFENDRMRLDEEFEKVLNDVGPEELRSYVRNELSEASLTPALLCLLSARATGKVPDARDAAGIQFVHAGLDATRRVLDDDSAWEDAGVEPVEEDMVLLAADVLVTVGFEYLLDSYEAATRVVNTFGSEKAREMESTDPKERFEHESAQFEEVYTTAVEIGCGDDPPEDLVSLAESLAVADSLGSSLDGDGSASTETGGTRRALSAFESIENGGYEAHLAAIRGESALEDGRCRTKGVEAQD